MKRQLLIALLSELGYPTGPDFTPETAADLVASGLELLDCDDPDNTEHAENLAAIIRDADWSQGA